MNRLAVARLRAIVGAVFTVLGLIIAIRLLLIDEPLKQKLLGLAFALVAIALGIVRVRGYLLLRNSER